MTDNTHRLVTRRRFVRATTTAGVAVTALGGAAGSAAAEEGKTDLPYEFDTVVNMVDAGADPTGEEPVDPLIREHAGDDTLLYFPEGRYKLRQYRNYEGTNEDFEPSLYNRYENFGLLGDGSGKSVLVAPEGQGASGGYFERLWFEVRYGRNILVEGFTLDITAERTGGRFQVVPTSNFVVRDVHVEGIYDANSYGPLLFWMIDPDGHGLVKDIYAPDGGDGSGIYVQDAPYTKGTIEFRDCTVVGFGEGLYASNPAPPGRIEVHGGYYANSNIAQVRLGTPGSLVKNTLVEVAEIDPATRMVSDDNPVNQRGIRVSDGEGVDIKNCEIVMTADTPSSGAIVAAQSGGDVTVKNTRIRVESPSEAYAVHAKSPDSGVTDAVSLKNVTITGDAVANPTFRLVDRDDVSLKNVRVRQPGADRDGIYARNSNGTLRNVSIVTGGEPLVLEDSEFSTRHLTMTDLDG